VTRVVLATANVDKASEIVELLGTVDGLTVGPRPEGIGEVEETGATLEANALLKARAVASVAACGAVADDTGLFVDALDGAPGVYSARYAGEGATYADNVAKLLVALDGVGRPRAARFVTVAALVEPDGREVLASGTLDGEIATAPRGDGGFGYDSVFVPLEGDGRTLAELSAEEKNAISHRGRAFRALAAQLGSPDEVPNAREG
jgi:XTP/dITP diphosphohydrolase